MTAKTVRIAGNQFPVEARPGADITYSTGYPEHHEVTGTVIDRAPQGVGDEGRYWVSEASGIWLWVQPTDGSKPVRVRYYSSGKRAGEAHTDSGPMVVRAINGPRREPARERATA